MGIFDFLTSGAPTMATSTSTSTQSLPPWYEDYQRKLLATGLSVGNENLQLYPHERISLPGANVTEAWDKAGQFGRAAYGPLSSLAVSATERGAAPFDPNTLKTFMNPYSEEVADIIGRRGEERYRSKFLDPVMDEFTQHGQFGSSRNMDFARRAMEDASREITDAQTQALSTGYQTGMQGYGNFQQLAQAGGKQAQEQMRGALEMMEAAGAGEQAQEQKSLDQAYKDFLEQREYPWTVLDRLRALGSGGASPGGTTTATQTAPTGGREQSTLEQLSGILAILQAATK